jgi:hypothetical protein
MTKKHLIQLFQERKVRTVWDDQAEKWYFSIVDVCGVLTDQPDYDGAKNYWKVLKFRLKKEGNESVTNCNQLKMVSPKDGKKYTTDVADIITQAWSGKTTRQYKQYKGLKKENLRDNMTNIELALNILAEASTTEISKAQNPKGFRQSAEVARKGGQIAGDARKKLEAQTGRSVISRDKASDYLPPADRIQELPEEDE